MCDYSMFRDVCPYFLLNIHLICSCIDTLFFYGFLDLGIQISLHICLLGTITMVLDSDGGFFFVNF